MNQDADVVRRGVMVLPVIREASAPGGQIGETRIDMPRETKDALIQLRVTPVERDAWQRAAEASEMSLSDWIRQRCNGPAALAPELPRKRP